MQDNANRPPFILATTDIDEVPARYGDTQDGSLVKRSNEVFSYGRALGYAAGLLRMRLHIERVPPNHRTDLPLALYNEEEFYYVLEGCVDAWIDGHIYPMKVGDLAAFPSGTGISHTFINNSDTDVVLLVGGERRKPDGQIFYPIDANNDLTTLHNWSAVWSHAPRKLLGQESSRPKGEPAISSAKLGLRDGIRACKNNTQRTTGF